MGTLTGTIGCGWLGMLPRVQVATVKPRLRNNGCNLFTGQPRLRIDGLADILREPGRAQVYGHVLLCYSDGAEFLAWACMSEDGTFSFS